MSFRWKETGRGRHPARWRNRNLGDDARAADAIEGSDWFEEFYEVRHRDLCWNVHGSGGVGLRNLNEIFPSVCGLAYYESHKFALFVAEKVFDHLGLLTDDARQSFDAVAAARSERSKQIREGVLERGPSFIREMLKDPSSGA